MSVKNAIEAIEKRIADSLVFRLSISILYCSQQLDIVIDELPVI